MINVSSVRDKMAQVNAMPYKFYTEKGWFWSKGLDFLQVLWQTLFLQIVKRHIVFNFFSFVLGRRVLPGCIFFNFIRYGYMVVPGLTFPWTDSMFIAFLKILPLDRIGRKVVIPFDYNGVIAFC